LHEDFFIIFIFIFIFVADILTKVDHSKKYTESAG